MIEKKIKNMTKHFCGVHDDCDHGKDFVPNYQKLTTKETIDELDRILSFFASQSSHTNINIANVQMP
jgi:hypothetical protein